MRNEKEVVFRHTGASVLGACAHGFLLFVLNTIFKMLNNSNKKFNAYNSTIYVLKRLFHGKPAFLCVYVCVSDS
jgi:hypothetical protein